MFSAPPVSRSSDLSYAAGLQPENSLHLHRSLFARLSCGAAGFQLSKHTTCEHAKCLAEKLKHRLVAIWPTIGHSYKALLAYGPSNTLAHKSDFRLNPNFRPSCEDSALELLGPRVQT